jgi:hypothetical protein
MGAWSMTGGGLGLYWAFGGPGFPFGAADGRAQEVGSLLASADATITGATVASLGLLGFMVATCVARGHRGRSVAVVCWPISAVLILAVPDIRVIQNFAYLFFGYTGLWDWPLLFMVVSILGGVLWAGVALIARPGPGRWTTGVNQWLVHHRTAITYAAAALALPYPVTRIAWAAGIPLGMPGIDGRGCGPDAAGW